MSVKYLLYSPTSCAGFATAKHSYKLDHVIAKFSIRNSFQNARDLRRTRCHESDQTCNAPSPGDPQAVLQPGTNARSLETLAVPTSPRQRLEPEDSPVSVSCQYVSCLHLS